MADDEGGKDTLRQFVENECKAQALRPPGTNSDDTALDAERMNRFYQRALNESERMSNEVTKSQKQRSELHKELSKDMLESWTQDHAQEVLCPQTYELWSKEEEKAKKVLQELEKASINDDESSDDASH
ncbi:unnamed protein product [Porites lobata]|uniref:Uncharacterized protein n=1 Tax=Porites lobata TaxID=104759 RepID=A0ABN8NZX0_9CNID|nr:unnamed protein product [Porites lobata]